MPTAAKALAAILLAALGFQVARMIIPLLPEGMAHGRLVETSTFFGFLSGWLVIGPKVGQGFASAFGVGLTGAAAMVAWGLFFNSLWQMITLSLRRQYEGPVDAFMGMLELVMENGLMMATPEIITLLAVGGIVIGLLAEAISKVAR